MLIQGQKFLILYSYFAAGVMQNSEITQSIPGSIDGDIKSDEVWQTCWFKAVRVLAMLIKTTDPHHPWSLLPMPGVPTPLSIAINLATRLSYQHQCMDMIYTCWSRQAQTFTFIDYNVTNVALFSLT